jgi:hypothetical protein
MLNLPEFKEIEGLQFVPLAASKKPLPEGWTTTTTRYDYRKAEGVGLVCGILSGNIEAIDIDQKYSLDGKLVTDYSDAIKKSDPNILNKLVIQKTPSGGYHFIYRCQKIDGNLKLANRYTTSEEKRFTYDKTLKHELEVEKKSNDESIKVATRAMDGDKVRVLLETRGEGGQIACYPTKGYKFIRGSFETIQEITIEEKELLFSIARQFNEVFEVYTPKDKKVRVTSGISPCDDYNERGDVEELLQLHGWKVVGQKGQKVLFLRPGDTKASHSGNFDRDRNWFSVFTTSTVFNPEKAYLPYMVYAILECDGDVSEATRKLYALDYGDRKEKVAEVRNDVTSRIDMLDDDFSFVAGEKDYNDFLIKLRNGTFELGKTTGFPILDTYFRLKNSTLVTINGHDNVGKSTFIWYLALLSNLLHGWKWIIYSSENSVGSVMRKMIEFYWCEHITKITEENYQKAKTHIEANFKIILSDDELYNYQDILKMTKKLLSKEKFNALLIDPYNSLKMDLKANTKLTTHDYHYEALSEIQLFKKKNELTIFLNCHAVTNALREKTNQGYAKAPGKADTEGGGKFANKTDDFITLHRQVDNQDEYMWTEFHVRKVKEVETGGSITKKGNLIRIRSLRGLVGFEQVDDDGKIFNPVLNFHGVYQEKFDKKPLINHYEPINTQQPINFTESKKEQEEFVYEVPNGDESEDDPF